MKRIILLLTSILSIEGSHTQVGINTTNPFRVFHIDPRMNTNGTLSPPINDSDDVIVNKDGWLGIGTTNPTAALDLRGNIRINDGTQSSGSIFTTDGTGLGYWDSDFILKILERSVSEGLLLGVGWSTISYLPITITEGKWLLSARVVTVIHVRPPFYMDANI
ncbi:hypothetical protein [Dysgonomonas sp. GY617]|uniref:hypothetical protein n=1 Tax=Dysgonomonas sp. GY617 TaxID=2780420 RepID=UPI0018843225|nr:hypothetical protein [Dysgonomonas sp. GY617]MBF0577157.1 hypothetical protein [Dysgonomonas sp. GY617]